jgi:hypothetical protein
VKRREEWRSILDAEVKRWETKSGEQLISELAGCVTTYEREIDSQEVSVRGATSREYRKVRSRLYRCRRREPLGSNAALEFQFCSPKIRTSTR